MSDYFNCQHCGELVSDEPQENELTCHICLAEIEADDQQGVRYERSCV